MCVLVKYLEISPYFFKKVLLYKNVTFSPTHCDLISLEISCNSFDRWGPKGP